MVNNTGRVRSIEENGLLIQALAYWQKQLFSLDQACKKCVEMFGGSHNVYKKLWNHYIENNNLNIASTHERRGMQPQKVIEINDIDNDIIDAIICFAFDYTVRNNTGFSVQDLLSCLLEEYNIILDESTSRYILSDLDFTWSNQSVYYGNAYEDGRIKELTRFLHQYSHALTLEKKGSHVLVATDESWSNQGTSFENSWIHKCPENNSEICYVCNKFIELANGDSKTRLSKSSIGKRVVFTHAITKDGLLCAKEEEEEEEKKIECQSFIKPEFDILNQLNIPLYTCELQLECVNDNDNDYHQQMNFEIYKQWFQNRLIPTFENQYPGKSGIFFMDQCLFTWFLMVSLPHVIINQK